MAQFDILAGALRDAEAKKAFDELVRSGASADELSARLEDTFQAGIHFRLQRRFREKGIPYAPPPVSAKERDALIRVCLRSIEKLEAFRLQFDSAEAVKALRDFVDRVRSPFARAFGFETFPLDFEEVLRHQERRVFEHLRQSGAMSPAARSSRRSSRARTTRRGSWRAQSRIVRRDTSVFMSVSTILRAGWARLKVKCPVSLDPEELKAREHRAKKLDGRELVSLKAFQDAGRLRKDVKKTPGRN